MEFKSKEYLEIIRTVNDIYNHSSGNITRVVPFSKEKFGLDNLVPMLVSAILSLIAMVTVIYGLEISLNGFDYLVLIGVPTIMGFFTDYLHKYL
jgi:hypothetical protein